MSSFTWLVLLLVTSTVSIQPIPPSYYNYYHQIQVSNCVNVSIACPKSFIGSEITSQVYFKYPHTNDSLHSKAVAQDTYNLLYNNHYSMDYTFISNYKNHSNLLETKI